MLRLILTSPFLRYALGGWLGCNICHPTELNWLGPCVPTWSCTLGQRGPLSPMEVKCSPVKGLGVAEDSCQNTQRSSQGGVSLCDPGWPQTCNNNLFQFPKCWNYRCEPTCPVQNEFILRVPLNLAEFSVWWSLSYSVWGCCHPSASQSWLVSVIRHCVSERATNEEVRYGRMGKRDFQAYPLWVWCV